MKRLGFTSVCALLLSIGILANPGYCAESPKPTEYTSTQAALAKITPNEALNKLIQGNKRFLSDKTINRNLLNLKRYTSKHGQAPSALVLSCMDSRGVPELIMDQGIGDIFTVRLAGNVIDSDQLGGMEYATKVVGSKLIVIMGHTKCGAVKGACEKVELGNLTQLLDKIEPAVETIKHNHDNKLACNDYAMVDQIAKQNVLNGIKQVKAESAIVKEMIKDNNVMIVGAMQNVETGQINFFDENGTEIN